MVKTVIDLEVAAAINQYLTEAGLQLSASAFQSECEKRKIDLQCPTSSSNEKTAIDAREAKKELIERFERGESEVFFSFWQKLFPPGEQRDVAVDVLEFYLHVYFATVPLRKTPPAKKEYQVNVNDLKKYLERGAGSKLSGTSELVQYFALPYVDDPIKHPVFKNLIQSKWVKMVGDKLKRQLNRRFGTAKDAFKPQLLVWMNAFENAETGAKEKEKKNNLSRDYRDLQEDYYKLIDIAGELIDCLEQSIKGKTVSAEVFGEISSRLAESSEEAERRMMKNAAVGDDANVRQGNSRRGGAQLQRRNRSFTRSTTTGGGGGGGGGGGTISKQRGETIRKSESERSLAPPADPIPAMATMTNASNRTTTDSTTAPIEQAHLLIDQLDYNKIVNQLIKNPTSRITALLLQALRQQITRSSSTSAQQRAVTVFIQQDLLSVKNRRNSAITAVFNGGDAGSEEELCRLLNTLASTRTGRGYLLEAHAELLAQIVGALRTRRLKHYAADHALAVMQKLSLSSLAQRDLVQLGALEWLFQLMDNAVNRQNDFVLEYASALWLNLCLNSTSQNIHTKNADLVMKVLINMFNTSNPSARVYVHSILGTVLGLGRCRAKARDFGLQKLIEQRLENEEHLGRDEKLQLDMLLRQLQGELDPSRQQQGEDDENLDSDYFEAEIESTDTLRPNRGEVFGECLLREKFLRKEIMDKTTTTSPAMLKQRDDGTVPPGTVPRAEPRRVPRLPPARQPSGVSGAPILQLDHHIPSERNVVSNMSHRTFILDNDRRRPRVNPSLILQSPASQSIDNNKSLISTAKPPISSSSSSKPPKAEKRQPNRPLSPPVSSTAPVTSNLPRRIPDDANRNEYIAVFGSRPKVSRTPDTEISSSTKRADVMLF